MSAVGVVGASARAAAMSALRAGFDAWAIDQYADRDLRRLAPCELCPPGQYPAALPSLAAHFPVTPFLYTGGLEAHPEVLAALATRRPLWGNGPDVLTKVRDPFWLHDTLKAHDLPTPRVLPGSSAPSEGRWLRKNPRLSGGLGVRSLDLALRPLGPLTKPPGPLPETGRGGKREDRPALPFDPPPRFGEGPGVGLGGDYLQEFLEGPSLSAVFVSGRNDLHLLGITEQLIGEPWLHAPGFLYCGNIGPVELPPSATACLLAVGSVLHVAAGLCGLWGVDFILHDGIPYPVEVNPRYTASVEVLELGSGSSALARHAEAFGHPGPAHVATRASGAVGKAVYFAPRDLSFPSEGPWENDLHRPFESWRLPGYADIPAAAERIERGRPVLTFFETGVTADECRGRLRERAAVLDDLMASRAP